MHHGRRRHHRGLGRAQERLAHPVEGRVSLVDVSLLGGEVRVGHWPKTKRPR